MGKWYSNTVPKCKEKTCSDEVLVTVQRGQYKVIIKAVFIPYHHCTVEDMGWNMYDGIPDDWEYVEEEDSWWVPEGWYETADYFDDYEYAEITDKVIAWSKLPKAYEPNIKQLVD